MLDVYARLKSDLGTRRESYLGGHRDPTGRMWMTRLRSGRHGLAVNTGRFKRPKPRREERWCEWCEEFCDRKVVEDERHVFFKCPRYALERGQMLNELGLDVGMGNDGSFDALNLLLGAGPGVQVESDEERKKRHVQVQRFLRRVLHMRIKEGEVKR